MGTRPTDGDFFSKSREDYLRDPFSLPTPRLAAAYPTSGLSPPADHRSSGASSPTYPLRPTKSFAHSIAPPREPLPTAVDAARPGSGDHPPGQTSQRLELRRRRPAADRPIPGLTPAPVGDQPTADAESIRRCIRVERDPSPRRPRASTSPATIKDGLPTAPPAARPRRGRRPEMADDHAQGLVHSDLDHSDLVRSDDAHQIKGQFILHMELMTVAIKCPSLLLKRNLMVTIFHTSIPGAYRS
ncbi:uncharacterized protein [Lolium perenne]|uniref:uncharacterized protein n=1 Tax=Lolium perenne TaxID=4522 RepID=UPI003A9971A3